MTIPCKKIILCTISAFLLIGCEPKKKKELPPSQPLQIQTVPKGEPSEQQGGETLTPRQQEELKINEDNVMNPFPG